MLILFTAQDAAALPALDDSCSAFLHTGEQHNKDALQEEGSLTLQVCEIQPQMIPGFALKPALVRPAVIRRLILQSSV